MKTTRLIGCRWKCREALSQAVLIGRGLDLNELVSCCDCLFSFEGVARHTQEKLKIAGAYGDEVPPVPIPNTEVKLISAEDTWWVTAWENRAVPAQLFLFRRKTRGRHKAERSA